MPEPLPSPSSPSDTSVLPTPRTPPGPRGLPWLGCTAGLLADPMKFWTRIARRFGGIASIPLKGGRRMLFVSEPRLIKELLIDHRTQYAKMMRYPAILRLLGEGLLVSEGDTWRRQRLLTQAAFKPAELDRKVQWMRPVVERFLQRWEDAAARHAVMDMEPEFLRLTQLLSGILALGPAFEARAEAFFQITEAVKHNWPVRPSNIFGALFPPRDDGRSARLEAAVQALDDEVFRLVRRQLAERDDNGSAVETLIAGAEKQSQPFTEKELRDQAVNLFIAGYETTTAGLCWTCKALFDYPQVRQRVHAEIDAVLGKRPPEREDLDRLDYLGRVLDESLRLYSPVHALSRTANEDNEIGGYPVPRGSTVTVSMHATHRLPEHWPDPERFDPDRFLPEACAARSNYAYIPFAVGHRNCIGGALAILESKLILALIAQRYQLDLAPGEKVEAYAGTTMRPRDGMRMVVRRR
jgi:cytochrome P450